MRADGAKIQNSERWPFCSSAQESSQPTCDVLASICSSPVSLGRPSKLVTSFLGKLLCMLAYIALFSAVHI